MFKVSISSRPARRLTALAPLKAIPDKAPLHFPFCLSGEHFLWTVCLAKLKSVSSTGEDAHALHILNAFDIQQGTPCVRMRKKLSLVACSCACVDGCGQCAFEV